MTEEVSYLLPPPIVLRDLSLRNVLSFGAEAHVDFAPLNVLIGPNGCGKSNLLDVVALLKAAATGDLSDEFRGGALDWPWKEGKDSVPEMSVQSRWTDMESLRTGEPIFYNHDMVVKVSDSGAYGVGPEGFSYFDLPATIAREEFVDSRFSILRAGIPMACKWDEDDLGEGEGITGEGFKMPEGIRASISATLSGAGIYRGRHIGRGRGSNPLRAAGRADGEKWRIPESLEDFSMVLNRVYPECGDAINEKMREFYEDARKLHFSVFDGAVQIKLEEAGGRIIPAHRMSDGMLNWLFLLTVLLDPKPPALVCLEEPETGLHPELLPTLAKMLIDASSRMQLIVTTHSETLVDCLTDLPEAVVVCDKVDGVTQMKRLRAEDYAEWKEEGLGTTWIRGAIGGTRW